MKADELLEVMLGVATTLSYVLGDSTEIAVHDFRQPDRSLVSIINGHVSGRSKNESILTVPREDLGLTELLHGSTAPDAGPVTIVTDYATLSRDGRVLNSSSALFRDDTGRHAVALCFNTDVGRHTEALRMISDLLKPPRVQSTEPVDSELSLTSEISPTVDQMIGEIIDEAINASGLSADRLKKSERIAAVAIMKARGLFLVRGSVTRVAERLGTTKFTIYNYLDEIAREEDMPKIDGANTVDAHETGK